MAICLCVVVVAEACRYGVLLHALLSQLFKVVCLGNVAAAVLVVYIVVVFSFSHVLVGVRASGPVDAASVGGGKRRRSQA